MAIVFGPENSIFFGQTVWAPNVTFGFLNVAREGGAGGGVLWFRKYSFLSPIDHDDNDGNDCGDNYDTWVQYATSVRAKFCFSQVVINFVKISKT